jgi:colanic acid/amylovoran biosynthesis protein
VKILTSDGGLTVGVTVRRWFREDLRQAHYEALMATFVDWLARDRGCRVVFVPQVTWTAADDDDREVTKRVANRVSDRRRLILVQEELDAPALQQLCGQMNLFVGTRLHSCLFALSMGVPALAIGYQPKGAAIMETLGLGDHVVPIEALTREVLVGAFDRLASRADDVRGHLDRILPGVRASARRPAKAIADDLERHRDLRPHGYLERRRHGA